MIVIPTRLPLSLSLFQDFYDGCLEERSDKMTKWQNAPCGSRMTITETSPISSHHMDHTIALLKCWNLLFQENRLWQNQCCSKWLVHRSKKYFLFSAALTHFLLTTAVFRSRNMFLIFNRAQRYYFQMPTHHPSENDLKNHRHSRRFLLDWGLNRNAMAAKNI